MFKKIISRQAQSEMQKAKNFNKHIRIAHASKNLQEVRAHVKRAAKLMKRYEEKAKVIKEIKMK